MSDFVCPNTAQPLVANDASEDETVGPGSKARGPGATSSAAAGSGAAWGGASSSSAAKEDRSDAAAPDRGAAPPDCGLLVGDALSLKDRDARIRRQVYDKVFTLALDEEDPEIVAENKKRMWSCLKFFLARRLHPTDASSVSTCSSVSTMDFSACSLFRIVCRTVHRCMYHSVRRCVQLSLLDWLEQGEGETRAGTSEESSRLDSLRHGGFDDADCLKRCAGGDERGGRGVGRRSHKQKGHGPAMSRPEGELADPKETDLRCMGHLRVRLAPSEKMTDVAQGRVWACV